MTLDEGMIFLDRKHLVSERRGGGDLQDTHRLFWIIQMFIDYGRYLKITDKAVHRITKSIQQHKYIYTVTGARDQITNTC